MERLIYTGSYAGTQEPGIRSFYLNEKYGTLRAGDTNAEVFNPSYLVRSGNGKYLYAVSEHAGGGEVCAFAIGDNGKLRLLNRMDTGGFYSCHLSVNVRSDLLAAANYGSGSIAVYCLNSNGAIEKRLDLVQHIGSGPNRARQNEPHAHCVSFCPHAPERLLAADLGCDAVFCYDVSQNGIVQSVGRIDFPGGSGPRHFVFNKQDPNIVYVAGELSLCVYTVRINGYRGEIIDQKSCVSPFLSEQAGAAAIRISPSGKWLYTSTRVYTKADGQDCIAHFPIDAKNGLLGEPGLDFVTGAEPRDILPVGNLLLTACQKSGRLEVFVRDEREGRLIRKSDAVDVFEVSCIC